LVHELDAMAVVLRPIIEIQQQGGDMQRPHGYRLGVRRSHRFREAFLGLALATLVG
jgi:hypothetical protein